MLIHRSVEIGAQLVGGSPEFFVEAVEKLLFVLWHHGFLINSPYK